MSILSLYIMGFPVGAGAILFAYQAGRDHVGRGERLIWLASSLGLLWSLFAIFLMMAFSA